MVGLKPPTVERDEERRGGGLCECVWGGGGVALGLLKPVESGQKKTESFAAAEKGRENGHHFKQVVHSTGRCDGNFNPHSNLSYLQRLGGTAIARD